MLEVKGIVRQPNSVFWLNLALESMRACTWFLETVYKKCVYVSLYVHMYACTKFNVYICLSFHVSKLFSCKSSLHTRNKGLTNPVKHLHTVKHCFEGGFLFQSKTKLTDSSQTLCLAFPVVFYYRKTLG